jgi:putative two-component system response regulator
MNLQQDMVEQHCNAPTNRILFVDDERSVLDAIHRALRKKFKIYIADSAETGLTCFDKEGPFPVVISDFEMPGMDGAAFLSRISKISPHTIRMMLTGHVQLETSIRAVNEGTVFRFLSKPCPMDILEKAINEGLHQYRLLETERDYYALKKWNESLGGLIQAFARLIESKDPYTAGHQNRVALFSVAIAEALHFPEEDIEQVRMAAMIHDIGKIYVPVEFLNKPGRLNPCEWNIVKMHAQIGHDILEPIEFPFPLHKIVLQHHERIDGSGYPAGLKNSEILVQARIIAVADTIEAIAHHRPYRPSRGLEVAMRELEDYSGIHYDPEIVDAALALLRNKLFQF